MKTLTPEMIGLVAESFRALADETRIRILLRLRQGECNVTALTTDLGVAQASVSKHLTVLRHAGIVAVRREGVQTICRAADPAIYGMCEVVCGGIVRRQEHMSQMLGLQPPARTKNQRAGKRAIDVKRRSR